MTERRVLRYSPWDAALVGLSIGHAIVLALQPPALVVALALWWNANTISHNFIHLPFFRSRAGNRAFAAWLTVLLGFPQGLWRARHLRHHACDESRVRWTREMWIDLGILLSAWTAAAILAPAWFALAYAPGWIAGLGLCWLQGHFEHARGTTSHYGRVYNAVFFNDGYHVEHHTRPSTHWSRLPAAGRRDPASSRWPAVLRWIERRPVAKMLDALEHVVLRSRPLQRWVLDRHERAFRQFLPAVAGARRITVVGGGLFPRTALVLQKLVPGAVVTILDMNKRHVDTARRFLNGHALYVHDRFDGLADGSPDVIIIPLAYVGDREAIYRHPPAPAVLVHDWAWSKRGEGARVSWLLLKRVNLVRA